MEGYIKIYRQLLDWEWYTDTPTKSLFIHLLLKANIKDGNWRGTPVKKGSLITGRKKLSEETGLSESQIRTSLEKLQSTNEIAIKVTKSFSVIELQNWDKYQEAIANKLTNESPSNRQAIATGGEGNKVISKESDTNTVAIATKNPNEEFFEKIQTDTDSVIDSMNIPEEQRENARRELFKFWNYWTEKDMRGKERWRKEKTFEVQRRLTTWLLNTKFTSNQKTNGKRFAD